MLMLSEVIRYMIASRFFFCIDSFTCVTPLCTLLLLCETSFRQQMSFNLLYKQVQMSYKISKKSVLPSENLFVAKA